MSPQTLSELAASPSSPAVLSDPAAADAGSAPEGAERAGSALGAADRSESASGADHEGAAPKAADRSDEAGGASGEALALTRLAGRAAAAKLGHDILALDVSQRLGLAETFLLASGANDRQIDAIVEAVEESLAAVGAQALRREGLGQANWVLLDFGDLIVHVQSAECRLRYALDRLWRDCPEIDLGLSDPPPAGPAATTGPAAALDD